MTQMEKKHDSESRLNYLKQQLPQEITRAVTDTLREDLGGTIDPTLDITASLIPADSQGVATIITREHGIFCGQMWAEEVFKQLGGEVSIEWHVQDGDAVEPNQALCTLSGPSRILLTGERNAMNFIQTLSGCATTVAEYAKQLEGTQCRLLDTRKTDSWPAQRAEICRDLRWRFQPPYRRIRCLPYQRESHHCLWRH